MPVSLLPFKRFILGGSLPSHDEHCERLNVPAGLAIFASDALSSSAYATDEILHVFSIALASGIISDIFLGDIIAIPIALAILFLMGVVILAYRQLIWEYPHGGGGYSVAKDTLGTQPSLIIAAALLIDYVLTAAVSVTAGVSALTSAFPELFAYRVILGIGFLWFITYENLRGLRESAKLFAFPSYLFIGSMGSLIIVGIYKWIQHPQAIETLTSQASVVNQMDWTLPMGFLLLKAFSSGCAALTGIEAISNGVNAFKEPAAKRANSTLVILGVLLGFLFLGITSLAVVYHITPIETETVISQLARKIYEGMPSLYYLTQISTMLILFFAANTSFSGFPRLASYVAQDGFMPRQFCVRGDKLVYSNGILFLGVTASLLILYSQGSPHMLIPLYAIGVFVAFSITQFGIYKRFVSHKNKGWIYQSIISMLGALITGIVAIVIGVTKFTSGAWIVILVMPLIVWIFWVINDHYEDVKRQLTLPIEGSSCPLVTKSTALVLVSNLHQGVVQAMVYAKAIAEDVSAIHVSLSPEGTKALREQWDNWGCNIPLIILESPYRSLTEPILHYLDQHERNFPNQQLTLIVPEFVTKKWWHRFLHNQSALAIKILLSWNRRAVVTTYRFYLDE